MLLNSNPVFLLSKILQYVKIICKLYIKGGLPKQKKNTKFKTIVFLGQSAIRAYKCCSILIHISL